MHQESAVPEVATSNQIAPRRIWQTQSAQDCQLRLEEFRQLSQTALVNSSGCLEQQVSNSIMKIAGNVSSAGSTEELEASRRV